MTVVKIAQHICTFTQVEDEVDDDDGGEGFGSGKEMLYRHASCH